jgi:hypothetical protein
MARPIRRRYRRRPAEVTSDRLLDHYERWHARLSGAELDAISQVRNALERIAEESQAAGCGEGLGGAK